MAKPAEARNGKFDPAVVKSLVGKVEGYFDDLDSERGKYMQRCRSIRESIAATYDEAVARNIPKKELRALVTARQKYDKAIKVLEDLEVETRETVELLAEAFGDAATLPLFQFKMKRAQAAAGNSDGAAAH